MQNAPATGRLAGLDVQRLKQMVVVMWRAGRGDTLVKIVPRGQVPDSERMIGYCTTLKYVAGRTPDQMESILGFRAGTKLQNGADIYRTIRSRRAINSSFVPTRTCRAGSRRSTAGW